MINPSTDELIMDKSGQKRQDGAVCCATESASSRDASVALGERAKLLLGVDDIAPVEVAAL